jgi:hypothetical protein
MEDRKKEGYFWPLALPIAIGGGQKLVLIIAIKKL